MRKIDWDAKLSDEDIAWVRQAGFMTEDQLERHQAQYDAEVPEVEIPEDQATRSALDPKANAATPTGQKNGPLLVDPTKADPPESSGDDEGDDYDSWKVPELEAEVTARNQLENTTTVEVTGTGRNGAVTKADLVKGLRLWDVENPQALQ